MITTKRIVEAIIDNEFCDSLIITRKNDNTVELIIALSTTQSVRITVLLSDLIKAIDFIGDLNLSFEG